MNTLHKIEEQKTLPYPPHAIQTYISEMLIELSAMAQSADLRELASLLRATHAAASIDIRSED